jgi:ABC-type branched-subunit amino acid transport system substrate-binding protein
MSVRAGALAVLTAVAVAAVGPTTAGSAESVAETASPAVTADVIKIGMHAPLTGAVPLPSRSMQENKDLFFRWLERNGRSVNGRRVEVVLRNDNTNPQQALEVCKELVEEEKVFLIMGFSGENEMQSCARYADSQGVPYLSRGTTKVGLRELQGHFAISMSWPRQARLLADRVLSRMDGKSRNNGVVYTNTPTRADAAEVFTAQMESKGRGVQYSRRVPKTAGSSEAQVVATELRVGGIQNVFVHVISPTFFIQLVQASSSQGYYPEWTAVGGTLGPDSAATILCRGEGRRSFDGSVVLAPYPAWRDRGDFNKGHDKARAAFYRADGGDDTSWNLWAQQRAVAKMLRKPGRKLTRSRFIRVVRESRIARDIGSRLFYKPNRRFPANEVHVLKADCDIEGWRTVRAFARGFR